MANRYTRQRDPIRGVHVVRPHPKGTIVEISVLTLRVIDDGLCEQPHVHLRETRGGVAAGR
ncbi:hypothetical protein GCM10011320_29260 [Neoroseomonas lacus]|uniref:Uncharacterized protein n=1 Tax=Neoroseomonas lacus TaxID=287609 RepID=A0A917NR02_9PROT|nr:hypothetical protein GCM10011320_29260 [Neoroseomonas lacus]